MMLIINVFPDKERINTMNKNKLFVTALLVITLLSVVFPSPVSAGGSLIGEKIRVFNGSREFPAEAPFYIMHGWIETSYSEAIGVYDFELDVDGVPMREDFKRFSVVSGDPDTLSRLWIYTFPDGMTGTHTFTGHWYAPCQYAVNYTGICLSPNTKVENFTATLTVTFIP
jgi:hypothetical protein